MYVYVCMCVSWRGGDNGCEESFWTKNNCNLVLLSVEETARQLKIGDMQQQQQQQQQRQPSSGGAPPPNPSAAGLTPPLGATPSPGRPASAIPTAPLGSSPVLVGLSPSPLGAYRGVESASPAAVGIPSVLGYMPPRNYTALSPQQMIHRMEQERKKFGFKQKSGNPSEGCTSASVNTPSGSYSMSISRGPLVPTPHRTTAMGITLSLRTCTPSPNTPPATRTSTPSRPPSALHASPSAVPPPSLAARSPSTGISSSPRDIPAAVGIAPPASALGLHAPSIVQGTSGLPAQPAPQGQGQSSRSSTADAPLDLSASGTGDNSGNGPLDLTSQAAAGSKSQATSDRKRKCDDSDDDVIVVGETRGTVTSSSHVGKLARMMPGPVYLNQAGALGRAGVSGAVLQRAVQDGGVYPLPGGRAPYPAAASGSAPAPSAHDLGPRPVYTSRHWAADPWDSLPPPPPPVYPPPSRYDRPRAPPRIVHPVCPESIYNMHLLAGCETQPRPVHPGVPSEPRPPRSSDLASRVQQAHPLGSRDHSARGRGLVDPARRVLKTSAADIPMSQQQYQQLRQASRDLYAAKHAALKARISAAAAQHHAQRGENNPFT